MGFSNPITGGEDLIRSGIRSPNYAAGVAGWRIAQDGSAEFNNVTIRGTLSAGTISGDLVMAGGCIKTAAAGQRITICGAPANQVTFYTGQAAEAAPGYLQVINSGPLAGFVKLFSPDFGSGQSDLLLASGPGYNDFQLDSSRGALFTSSRGITWNGALPFRWFASAANVGRVGPSIPHGADYFEFANDFSTAAGDYCLLQYNDGTTYLNCAAGKQVNIRAGNVPKIVMDGTGRLTGTFQPGPTSTFAELVAGGALTGSGTPVNFIVQAWTQVITFGGGNSNINYPASFPHGVLSVVVSNGDGGAVLGIILDTVSSGLSSSGINAMDANAVLFSGVARINCIAVGW